MLWHHDQNNYKDILFAKQLLYSLESSGKKVFPDFRTNWHFDDKLGQKYLFEALNIPNVKTYIFYKREEAINWAKQTSYPKVFKLRGGAGSENVRIVKNYREGRKIIMKAFGKGFLSVDPIANLSDRINRYNDDQIPLSTVLKGIFRVLHPPEVSIIKQRERGYVYFQDFVPENKYDIRVVSIGSKTFAIKRIVRRNDFRASGSGIIQYDPGGIETAYIKLAFELNKKLQAQCIAYDFVKLNGEIRLLEISYGFWVQGYRSCPGYWDDQLKFHSGYFYPEDWILEELMKS